MEDAGIRDVSCLSAGFMVSSETRSPSPALAAATRYGVSLESHRTTALDLESVQAADAVIVMEAAHLRLLSRLFPGQRDKVYLLPLFLPEADRPRGYLRYTIADPYGQPQEEFDECYARISMAIDGMLASMLR